MNRRGADRLSADSHDLASKQRIVRRRVHRSPSPPIPRSASHREVRTSTGEDVYSKMGHTHRSHKYLEFRHSTGDLRDERLGGSKDRGNDGGGGGFNPRHHDNLENQVGVARGAGMRKGSIDSGGGGYQSAFHDKFEYSLHVCNIHTRLTDGEAKINLFREFKKFGFVNIKVIGFRKDRHAFINFTRLEDARAALASMNNAPFYGLNLTVTWSRATLNRYPHIVGGSHSDRRSIGGGGGVSSTKGRSFQHDGGSPDYFNPSAGGGGRHSDHFQDSPRNTRDINFQHSSPPPPSAPRNHSIHPSKDISVKGSSGPMPIIDPNATRTLFVGNLESDVTERELRDLFSPYGRIESVDIKVQRSISTAYAFVKFFTITDAMNAKTDMHGRKYGNIKLKIGFGKGSPSAKVWVGNLTTYADLTEIRTELDRFGLIRRVDYTNGDNHAFVHFDSLDAAQAAVTSLATYRFRSNNRPLKIDLSQPVRPGSDFEDFEPDYHDSVQPIGTGNSRQVHSRAISPDINSHSMMPPRRSGGMPEDFPHSMSHDEDMMGQHMGMSSVKSNPFRNSRGRRVVTEVHDSAHSRHTPNNGMDYSGDRGNYRKRGRSPGMPGNSDLIDHRPHSFHRHHSERGGAQSNGGSGHRMGGGSAHNGDFEYKPKRPRNGFDAYQYHKLHGDRGSVTDRIGSSSSIHSGGSADRERDFRDRDRGDDRGKDRRSGSERRERELRDREHRRRSSSAKSDRKGNDNEERSHSRSTSRRNSMSEAAIIQEKKIEEVSPPPPPPPPAPPIMDIMSYETSDPALKLNDSTGPTSPTGGNQPGDLKEVETLLDMARVYPVVWHGNLVLKNTGFPTRMHLIGGDPAVAELLVRCKDPKDESDSLRITQRLRLEPPRLEEVNKRMTSAGPSGHCILLALPGAIPNMPAEDNGDSANSGMQLRPLKSLVSYLDQKEAAGIVALNAVDVACANAPSGGQKENIIGVLHAFPPCEFSQSQLLKIAPNLSSEPAKEDHVVVLLVKGTV